MKLRRLIVSHNHFVEFPSSVLQLTDLTVLNLSNNQIRSIPAEIEKMEYLVHLNLSYNQITELPPEIGELQSLTYLNLNNNQITQLPSEIGDLEYLDNLDLRDIVSPFLERLATETNSTALLGLISAEQVFIIAKHEGAQNIGVTIRLGHR